MICSNRLKTEGLLFFIPFVVTLHYDNTPVFDEVEKSFFIEEFLNSSVDNEIKGRFVSPLHELDLTVLLFFKFYVLGSVFFMLIEV